jgi:hypothetical protein
MHGDFSLNPLAYRDRVSRVLLQQGRVQLDSDANEQTESFLRYLRWLASDLIGAHGGVDNGFRIEIDSRKAGRVLISWGIYYVDGIRCLNLPEGFDLWSFFVRGGRSGPVIPPPDKTVPAPTPAPAPTKKIPRVGTNQESVIPTEEVGDGLAWSAQADYRVEQDDWKDLGDRVLFYLDIFERHVAATEDESLREVALLGPDTASRAVVIWQVKALAADAFLERLGALDTDIPPMWDAPYVALNSLLRTGVRLRAQAIENDKTDACTISPDARYRGTENRLFRVEIHDPGDAKGKPEPTFKWSPDNAAIVYPVRKIEGKTVHLDSLGRDDRTSIRINDWVEVVDDEVQLMGRANPLLQVVDIRPHELTVTLSGEPKDNAGSDPALHPILRRWAAPPAVLREGKTARDAWFELADGVEVQFSRETLPDAGYRTGDYWLIPTRTATGDVQWPQEHGVPSAVPPHGVDHHYAPLAIVDSVTGTVTDRYRRSFQPLATSEK